MRRWMVAMTSVVAMTPVVAMTSAAIASAGTALAASAAWHVRTSPNATVPGGQINSVSCSAASSCTAVGTYVNKSGINVMLAERWNGSGWHQQAAVNPGGGTALNSLQALFGVSCPSASFCAAVGVLGQGSTNTAIAEEWDGHSWTAQSVAVPAGASFNGFSGVSCTSPTFCEAVGSLFDNTGSAPLAVVWNGTSWADQAMPNPGFSFLFTREVSCASPTFCEMLGTEVGSTFAEQWNGSSWQIQSVPTAALSVSCASASFCEATGGIAAVQWNGSSWSTQTLPSPASATSTSVGEVSCSSATFCEAAGSYLDSSSVSHSLAETWNGTSWSASTPPTPAGGSGSALSLVACTAADACEAVGTFQPAASQVQMLLAEAWNGSSWTAQQMVEPRGATPNSLAGVSCVAATFCEAVGSRNSASGSAVSLTEEWNGTVWTVQATPHVAAGFAAAPGPMNAVSCVSGSFCEAVGAAAVGTAGAAQVWHGTRWAVQVIPSAEALSAVSCVSPTFCEAVGGSSSFERWNGRFWSSQTGAAGLTNPNSVSCASAVFCEVSGVGPAGRDAEVWNGKRWSLQATPTPPGGNSITLSAVSCATASSCEAVGGYGAVSTGAELTLVERWNGHGWAVQHSPTPKDSAGTAQLAAVACRSADSCTAVGQYQQNVSFLRLPFAEAWDGTTWRIQVMPGGGGADVISGVSCGAATTCTAVGATTADPAQISRTLVEVRG